MIPLEQQVVSLEQAKKLKELGVKQNSLFYIAEKDEGLGETQDEIKHVDYVIETFKEVILDRVLELNKDEMGSVVGLQYSDDDLEIKAKEYFEKVKVENEPIYSAFTCAELGVMLWDKYNILRYVKKYEGSFDGKTFGFNAFSYLNKNVIIYDCFPTESEARAALLINLLEQKIISVDEVNKKL